MANESENQGKDFGKFEINVTESGGRQDLPLPPLRSGETPTGLIVGLVIGAVVLVLALIFAAAMSSRSHGSYGSPARFYAPGGSDVDRRLDALINRQP